MDTIIGCIILVAVHIALIGLVLWARWVINLIADKNLKTVRDIMEELHRVRKT